MIDPSIRLISIEYIINKVSSMQLVNAFNATKLSLYGFELASESDVDHVALSLSSCCQAKAITQSNKLNNRTPFKETTQIRLIIH